MPKLRIKNIYFYLQGIPRTGKRQKVSCYLISESKNKIKLKIGNDPEFNTGERILMTLSRKLSNSAFFCYIKPLL